MAVHCDIEYLSKLDSGTRAEWASLVAERALNPTSTPEWIELVDRCLGSPNEPVMTFVHRDGDGALLGVVPFVISRQLVNGLPLRVLQLATNRISYHVEIPSRGDPHQTIVHFFKSVRGWDLFHAANLNEEGATAAALGSMAGQHSALIVSAGESSPYLPLQGTWSDLVSSKNKKFRYKVRRRKESLEAHPTWKLVWVGECDVEQALEDIVNIERHSWKADAGIDIPSRSRELEYHKQLLPFLAQRRSLLANILYIEDCAAAYSLCCHAGAWIGQLKTSFDTRFDDHSPGAIVIDACLEKAFELGAAEFDFLGDATPHKLAWTEHVRLHMNYFLFGTTIAGRIVGTAKRLKQKTSSLRRRLAGERPSSRKG